MHFARALPQDAALLTELAFASKRHWGYPEACIEEWRGSLTVQPEFVLSREVWTAVTDGTTIGFYALGPKDDGLELLHFWVRPEWIGRGIGRELFLHASNKARELGCKNLYIESDPNAEGFYRRMGARRIGTVPSTVAGQPRELPLLAYELVRCNTL